MSAPKLVQVIHQPYDKAPGDRNVSIFHVTHKKGREEIVLSQPTPAWNEPPPWWPPENAQLVEVAVDIFRLDDLIEALTDLRIYLKPTPAPLGSAVPPGPAGSLEL